MKCTFVIEGFFHNFGSLLFLKLFFSLQKLNAKVDDYSPQR